MMGLILIPIWRTYLLYGWSVTGSTISFPLKLSLALTLGYLILLRLKKEQSAITNFYLRRRQEEIATGDRLNQCPQSTSMHCYQRSEIRIGNSQRHSVAV